MTQYHFLDESGDPGLVGSASSSSHFALAMVQLTERAPLPDLARTRQRLHLPPGFEFKYHKTTLEQGLYKGTLRKGKGHAAGCGCPLGALNTPSSELLSIENGMIKGK